MARKIVGFLSILLLASILTLLIDRTRQRAGSPTAEALLSAADFTGWVMGVDPGSGQIKVESQADKIVRPLTMKLTTDTLIFRGEAGVLMEIDLSAVHFKDQAGLWPTGPVPGSFPGAVSIRQVRVDQLY